MLEPHLRTPDASDVEFLHSPTLQGGEPPPARAAIWWIVAAVLTIATAVGIYIATSRRAVPPAATAARAASNTASDRPLGTTAIGSTFRRSIKPIRWSATS